MLEARAAVIGIRDRFKPSLARYCLSRLGLCYIAVDRGGSYYIYELGNRKRDIAELRKQPEEILPQNISFRDFEVQNDLETIGPRIMHLSGR
jgi:hypothetical protein